jgi:prepilin-type N-terminal cleavage/methylation domain-containing protein
MSARRGSSLRSRELGYSLVEMVMTLAIGLILVSVALPMLVGAIQGYRLNSIAQQTADLIDLTRYTAIRRNAIVSLHKTVQNGSTVFYIDLKGNGILDAGDPMMVLPNDMQLANGQSLTPGAASTGVPSTQDFTDTIQFDYRGTVYYPSGSAIGPYFLALGYTIQTQYGFRAITVIAMGQTKIWKASVGGTWALM